MTDENKAASINSKSSDDSFLTEDQMEGKAQGDVHVLSLDEAIKNISDIINPEAVKIYKEKPEEEWPTCKMEVYNHELRQVVPAGLGQTLKGNPRTVCGLTGSKKISIGRRESLQKFYHINPEDKAETLEEAQKRVHEYKKQKKSISK